MIKQSQIIGNQDAIMEGQRKAAEKQSGYMEQGLAETRNSIAEAARSAAAMEGIAKSLSDSAATAQQSLGVMGQMLATNNHC